MAEAKKAALKTAEAKTETKLPDTKTMTSKVEAGKVNEVKKGDVKAEPAKPEAVKADPVKKESVRKPAAAKKPAAVKKPMVPGKTATRVVTAQKTEVSEVVNFEFNEKSYTSDELLKIAKDVFKYDLKMKANDLKSINLYVKPEENLAYYVINGDITGSFLI